MGGTVAQLLYCMQIYQRELCTERLSGHLLVEKLDLGKVDKDIY